MAKIRKFKIGMRPREIERRAKKARLDLKACSLDAPGAVEAFASRLLPRLEPAVVYRSFSPDHARADLAPMRGLGFSLGIATLGPGAEAFIDELLELREEAKAPVARIALEVALEDAVQFVLGLLKQEAEEETCDLSPIGALSEPAAVEAAASELSAERIAVRCVEGRLEPPRSAAFGVSWIARPRSRKAARR